MSRPVRLSVLLVLLAIIAVVIRQFPEPDVPRPAKPTPDLSRVHELTDTLERAVKAYNSSDLAKLRAEFSATAPGLGEDGAFQRLYFGYYFAEFGALRTTRLSPRESTFDPDRGLLVFDAVFEKQPKAKLSANFLREEGAVKLAQVRIEKVEN